MECQYYEFRSIYNSLVFIHVVKDTFGIFNAPPAFQTFMNECLLGLKDSICIPYLDDILCYAKSFDEHLDNLRTVLRQLKSYGVKLKAEKCVYFRKEIKY